VCTPRALAYGLPCQGEGGARGKLFITRAVGEVGHCFRLYCRKMLSRKMLSSVLGLDRELAIAGAVSSRDSIDQIVKTT